MPLKQLITFGFTILFALVVNQEVIYAQVVINEGCASNSSTISDHEGDFADWIEIYNAGDEPVDLKGYCLSDDRYDLLQWCFPEYLLQPEEHLLVFSSGKNLTSSPSNWKALVVKGDLWRYKLPETNIPGWWDPGFDDREWEEGKGGFGYGDGDDATIIPPTTALYMRKSFNIEDVSAIETALFHIDYDDGFVAYINGVEIARANMNGSPPVYNAHTPNGREAQMYSGGAPERYDISNPQNIFREGENVLAVEVHNHSEGSSDLSSIPFLSILSQVFPGTPPPLILGFENRLFHTSFRLDADGDSLFLTNAEGTVVDSMIITWQAKDHSFGKVPGGLTGWYLFENPTPGEPNYTKAYEDYQHEQPLFTKVGGRFQAPFQLSLSSSDPQDSIYFTTNGSEPDSSSQLYEAPIHIAEGTVVKAVISKEGYLSVQPAVHTFIPGSHEGLSVISISTDHDNLWDHQYGIYVKGPYASNDFPFFGANFWNDWERPVHIQMYDENDSVAYSIGAGMKIFGGWSRGHPQKSLSLFARVKYGDRKLEYQLFPGIPIYDFEAFVLRNSGNDWFGAGSEAGTMFRDLLMTSLMKNMDVEYQKGRQAILYINGDYFGIHNIREKVNEHFLESNTGIDSDRVELLTNNQEVIIGSNVHYRNLYNFISTSNLQIQANYEYVRQRMDINNFIQYQLSEIYFGNTDWPGNNIKYWRPDYENGCWRWIIYDTDFGFGMWDKNKVLHNTLEFALAPNNTNHPNPAWSTLLFRKLLTNSSFKNQFINSFADQINTTFQKSNIDPLIDELIATIKDEMVHHAERWGGSYQNWGYRTNDLKYFAQFRPTIVFNQIVSRFGLGGTHKLNLDVSQSEMGGVKLNTLILREFPWKGNYFQGVTVEIVALPEPGYKFSHWSGSASSAETHIQVNLDDDLAITAHFIVDPDYNQSNYVKVNEISYNSDSIYSTRDWIELVNRTDQYVDMSGWIVRDNYNAHIYAIRDGTVMKPNDYHVVCRDKYSFRAVHADVENFEGNFDFGLSSDGDMVRIYNRKNELMNLVSYEVVDPWPVIEPGSGFTLSLISPERESYLAESWAISEQRLGTPDRQNFGKSVDKDEIETIGPVMTLRNYPNPFIHTSTIGFYSERYQHVRLTVYNLNGRVVEVVMDEMKPEGFHQLNWSPSIPAGVYILRLEISQGVHTNRIIKIE